MNIMTNKVLMLQGKDIIIDDSGDPIKIPPGEAGRGIVIKLDPHQIIINELNNFKKSIKRRHATFLDKNKSLAQAIDALSLSPDTTLAPEKAPETWSNRPAGMVEDPPSFLLRVYEPWLGKGLTRKHVRALDRLLYDALATHVRRHGVPEELRDFFPDRSGVVEEELKRHGISKPRDALDRLKDRREAERLYSAAYRRQRGGDEPSR